MQTSFKRLLNVINGYSPVITFNKQKTQPLLGFLLSISLANKKACIKQAFYKDYKFINQLFLPTLEALQSIIQLSKTQLQSY